MQKIRVELNVFHDGQFFTAVFEESGEEGCRAAKMVFAQKPSDRAIERIICESYYRLDFSLPVQAGVLRPLSRNPKRRQRQGGQSKGRRFHQSSGSYAKADRAKKDNGS